MPEGKYLYCILEGERLSDVVGIGAGAAHTIGYQDVSAVVSDMPFAEVEATIECIVAHQRVVEAARKVGTVLPVKFGVIFKGEAGVKGLLRASYPSFKSKMAKLRGRDEFGLRVLLEKGGMERIERLAQDESEEARRIKEEISLAGPGATYLLQLKLKDLVKREALKRSDEIGGEIHRSVSELAVEARLQEKDLEHVLLKGAYLVNHGMVAKFNSRVQVLRERYEGQALTFHLTGPWAPYSFCENGAT